jgi:hypothetical protein
MSYDFDKLYDTVALYRTGEQPLGHAQLRLGDDMAEEVLRTFPADDYDTVARTLMLTAGMLANLTMLDPIFLGNIVAIAGQHVMAVHKGIRVT